MTLLLFGVAEALCLSQSCGLDSSPSVASETPETLAVCDTVFVGARAVLAEGCDFRKRLVSSHMVAEELVPFQYQRANLESPLQLGLAAVSSRLRSTTLKLPGKLSL